MIASIDLSSRLIYLMDLFLLLFCHFKGAFQFPVLEGISKKRNSLLIYFAFVTPRPSPAGPTIKRLP